VGHGAQKELGPEHPVGPVVLRVLRFAGNLRDQVGGGVVLPDQPVLLRIGHGAPPAKISRSQEKYACARPLSRTEPAGRSSFRSCVPGPPRSSSSRRCCRSSAPPAVPSIWTR